MPAGTAAGKAETALKAGARKKGLKGHRAKRYIYGAMNNQGLMHGSEVTAKGMRERTATRRMTGY